MRQENETRLGSDIDPETGNFVDDRDDWESDEEALEKKPGWQERMHRILRNPYGQVAVYLLMIESALAGGILGTKRIFDLKARQTPQVSCTLGRGTSQETQLDFEDWPHAQIPQEEKEIPIQNGNLKNLVQNGGRLGEAPYAHVKDEKKFDQWVENQLHDSNFLDAIRTEDFEHAPAKKWVELALAITTKNLSYDPRTMSELQSQNPQTRYLASSHLIESSDRLSVDEIIYKKTPTVCRHYAAINKAIFDSIKRQHPEDLKNVYMQVASSRDLNHAWNMVVEVTGPNSADIAFIDPTFKDEFMGIEYDRSEDFIQFLIDAKEKWSLDEVSVMTLAKEYFQNNSSTVTEEWRFLRMIYGSETDWKYKQRVGILEHLVSRPAHDFESLERSANKDPELSDCKDLRYHALTELRDLYCNPLRFGRPDDWFERAHAVSAQIAKLQLSEKQRNLEQIAKNIPSNPEDWFDYQARIDAVQFGVKDRSHSNDEYYLQIIRKAAQKRGKTDVWWRNNPTHH